MNPHAKSVFWPSLTGWFVALVFLAPAARTAGAEPDISFRNEIQHGIDRGLAWLGANQNSNGWWSTPDNPAVTALAIESFLGEPSHKYATNLPPGMKKALAYVLASAQPDGSIQRGQMANYNTAISARALAMTGNRDYDAILARARAYLIGSQTVMDKTGKSASPYDGGIGYSGKENHSDLSNTLIALEALRATERVKFREGNTGPADLDWNAAIRFIQNCQNLPAVNAQSWVSDDAKDVGGFIYYPGRSNAGGVTNATTGRVALRSYGSISYAGLLSYIYADVQPGDPRVKAVRTWLRDNYTLEENPGMGPQGLYYYLHLMTKGLNAAGVDRLELKDGRSVDWRHDVAMRLLNLQQRDGSWVNTANRWWEKDPNLVTAYSVLALEILWRKI
jgi:squalene-hopene/tetraprenyl-beta-curcumene cyclase